VTKTRFGPYALLTMLLILSVGSAIISAHKNSTPTSDAWNNDIVGTLDGNAACSNGSSIGHYETCESSIPNLPTKFRTENLDLRVVTESSKQTCYGVSISSSYLAGINSFCVGGYAHHDYRLTGPAAHFRDLNVSLFVTSNSNSGPIGPIPDTSASPFQIVVTGFVR
jgi:hypothetical protein